MSHPEKLIWAVEKAREFGILPRVDAYVSAFSAGITTSTFHLGVTLEKEHEE